jgi:hypothetical protein
LFSLPACSIPRIAASQTKALTGIPPGKRARQVRQFFAASKRGSLAMPGSVCGVYATKDSMEGAVQAMKDAGFSSSQVSVLFPDSGEVDQSLSESGELVAVENTKGPQGVAAGAASGAMLGGVLGWLVGAGALVIPGIGPFLAAGPIMAALTGTGVGCALGGFTGALIGVGISEDQAKRYEGRMLGGGILVCVRCRSAREVHKIISILQATGADEISSTGTSGAREDSAA